jgi:hypothetical protein
MTNGRTVVVAGHATDARNAVAPPPMSSRQSAGVHPHHDLSTFAQRTSTSAAASALACLCNGESLWCSAATASSSGRANLAKANHDES